MNSIELAKENYLNKQKDKELMRIGNFSDSYIVFINIIKSKSSHWQSAKIEELCSSVKGSGPTITLKALKMAQISPDYRISLLTNSEIAKIAFNLKRLVLDGNRRWKK